MMEQEIKFFFFLLMLCWSSNVGSATHTEKQGERLKSQAYYPGGNRKLFIDALHGRDMSYMCDWQGYFHVKFRIDSMGKVQAAIIPEPICPDLKAKLLKAFNNMPEWIPAKSMLNKRVQTNVIVVFKWYMNN